MSTWTDIGTGRTSASLQSYSSVPEALNALAAAVSAAQQAGPLSPATVIALSGAAALDVAHSPGRAINDGRGSAAISAFILADLAEELAAVADGLSGRAPVSPTLREGAVTAVLAEAPGLIAAVADQPATACIRGQRTDPDLLPYLRSRCLEEEPWLSI